MCFNMDFIILSLLILIIIILVLSLFKNNNGTDDKISKLEVNMTKEIGDFKNDLENGNLKKLHKIVKIIRLSYKGQL